MKSQKQNIKKKVIQSDTSHEESATEASHATASDNSIKPQIQLPPITGQVVKKDKVHDDNKTTKKHNSKKLKNVENNDKSQDKKPKEQDEPKHEKESGNGMMTAIYAFVGINILLALIGGIAFFVIKRQKAKTGNTDTEETQEKSETIEAPRDNKDNDAVDKAA